MADLKPAIKARIGKLLRRLNITSPRSEPMMYRVYLFEELLSLAGSKTLFGKRILEIGPRDGLDSKRLASLQPGELVLIDLPEKKDLVDHWLSEIQCPHRYLEVNFMYMPLSEYASLGKFDLIWCTGVLYHNAEQLRFLRKLYKLLNSGGYLVLESATLRQSRALQKGSYVELHYPETYRNTGTITHLPSAGAIQAWLHMVGFHEIDDSKCFDKDNRNLRRQRYACICRKTGEDEADVYYGKSGRNPGYKFGDSV